MNIEERIYKKTILNYINQNLGSVIVEDFYFAGDNLFYFDEMWWEIKNKDFCRSGIIESLNKLNVDYNDFRI